MDFAGKFMDSAYEKASQAAAEYKTQPQKTSSQKDLKRGIKQISKIKDKAK